MKNAGILLKAGFVVVMAIGFSSAAYSQGAVNNPGQNNSATLQTNPSKLKGGQFTTAEESKMIISQQEVIPVANPGSTVKNCTSKSTMKPWSITRKSFNNLPADRQQFILNNSGKYIIVD